MVVKIRTMEWLTLETNSRTIVLSSDGDFIIREADWLRLWTSEGVDLAHDVWVGTGAIVYESSGPGEFVRRNWLGNVLVGRKGSTPSPERCLKTFPSKMDFAESKLGTLWAGFYNCQDFASEVATGKPQSFWRDAVVALSMVLASLILVANQQQPRRKRHAWRYAQSCRWRQ